MMTFACSHCGYRSEAKAFFRRERVWYAPLRKWFCDGCSAYVPSQVERPIYRAAPMLLALGAAATQLEIDGPVPGIGYILVLLSAMLLSAITVIVVHEAGHACAGWLVGVRITKMVIGSGPVLADFRVGRTSVQLRTFPTGGGVTGYHLRPEPGRWRHALYLAGGVLANAAFVAAIFACFGTFLGAEHSSSPILMTMIFGLIAAHLLAVVVNLRPRTMMRAEGPVATDGRSLLRLLRAKDFQQQALAQRLYLEASALSAAHRFSEACTHLEAAVIGVPPRPALVFGYLFALTMFASPERALAFYFASTIDLEAVDPLERPIAAYAYAMLSWIAVVTRDEALTDFADAMSRKAQELLPGPAEIEGMRAVAQIWAGRPAEGAPQALRVMRMSENELLRAEIALHLAHAERAGGDAERADEFLELSVHLRERIEERFRRGCGPS